MVLEFLRAEYDSPVWRGWIEKGLDGDLTAILEPRIDDPDQNEARKRALSLYRGYGRGDYIFAGFPSGADWLLVAATCAELGAFVYPNYETFATITRGTLMVRDGAANLEAIEVGDELNARVRAVADTLHAGAQHRPLIALARTPDSAHVLLEGNTRATAYVLTFTSETEVEVIAGYSPRIAEWNFYANRETTGRVSDEAER
jgi:hypothetical protein